MKIQKIRLKNLNSLAGDWEFDLTGDAYTEDGIFAITGPTGAGKTTILDAICLALYGCTPRLKTVSKSENEIMHRRAAECSAEVEIAVADGVYRCTWAQERAYGRPDGALQHPRHEIADAITAEIITTRKREVPRHVEEITGMDYERFTRSVMLAQGGFAAFLNASPNDRSPLLEQITGTAIYTEISIAVHQRRRDEHERLHLLEAEGEGISLLSEEERTTLVDEEMSLVARGQALEADIRRCREGILWHQEEARIAHAIADTQRDEADWTEERAAAEEMLVTLHRGETATALEADYRRITTLREGEANARNRRKILEDALPERLKAGREAEETVVQRQEALREIRNRAEEAAPVIREARALDLQLQTNVKRLAEVRIDAGKAAEEENRSRRELHRVTAANRPSPEAEEAALRFLRENGITADPQSLRDRVSHIAATLLTGTPCYAATLYQSAEEETAALQQSLTGIAYYRDTAPLRRELAVAREQKTQLMLCRDRLRDAATDADRMAVLTRNQQQKTDEGGRYRTALATCKTEREARERLIAEMERAARLASRVRDLEEERSRLRPGEPCPLCGATAHPYTDGGIPLPDPADEELQKERAALAALREKEAALVAACSRCKSEGKAAEAECTAITTRAAAREDDWNVVSRACNLDPDSPDREEVVHAALDDVYHYIEEHEIADTAIESLRDDVQAITGILGHCHEAIRQMQAREEQNARVAAIETNIADIRETRFDLLGDMAPDEAEEQFARMNLHAEEAVRVAENERRRIAEENAGIEGEIRTLRETVQSRETERRKAEEQFSVRLSGAGFYGEEDFSTALITPDELAVLRENRDRLEHRRAGIAARYAALLTEADAHRDGGRPAQDEASLRAALTTFISAEQETNTHRGEIRQQLRRHDEEAARFAGLQERIAIQQGETERWDELHVLIGSADGKKFRNFAQGLTFEVMIASANRQLQLMSDRYLLKQHPNEPLELVVSDNYQGGVVRSTRNLSGGESFLVSLALALGLASMSSGRIRVDSLFLDEGFGTLDSEALEMALSTLASLRDQGKTVGVISHVPALSERIGTVIRVSKGTGGRSTVRGPGVTCHRSG